MQSMNLHLNSRTILLLYIFLSQRTKRKNSFLIFWLFLCEVRNSIQNRQSRAHLQDGSLLLLCANPFFVFNFKMLKLYTHITYITFLLLVFDQLAIDQYTCVIQRPAKLSKQLKFYTFEQKSALCCGNSLLPTFFVGYYRRLPIKLMVVDDTIAFELPLSTMKGTLKISSHQTAIPRISSLTSMSQYFCALHCKYTRRHENELSSEYRNKCHIVK